MTTISTDPFRLLNATGAPASLPFFTDRATAERTAQTIANALNTPLDLLGGDLPAGERIRLVPDGSSPVTC